MMLFGLIWAVLAPLLLVPVILLVAYALRRMGKAVALAGAAAIVLLPVGILYGLDRSDFSRFCRETGRPLIVRRAVADGIFLNSETANSFGTRYVLQEGFTWMERQDIYNRSGFVRVARLADGTLGEEKIAAVSARYEVRETFETGAGRYGGLRIVVIDRQTGEEMARAADAQFNGGRLWWLLGAYGSTSCLSPLTDPAGFDAHYHLARDTLRP